LAASWRLTQCVSQSPFISTTPIPTNCQLQLTVRTPNLLYTARGDVACGDEAYSMNSSRARARSFTVKRFVHMSLPAGFPRSIGPLCMLPSAQFGTLCVTLHPSAVLPNMTQTQFKNCSQWKAQQRTLWAQVRAETGRARTDSASATSSQTKDSLASTDVGKLALTPEESETTGEPPSQTSERGREARSKGRGWWHGAERQDRKVGDGGTGPERE